MTKEEMINAIRVEMSSKSHIRSNYYMYQETLIGDVLEYIDSLETWLDGKDKAQWRQNVFWLLTIWEKKKLYLNEQSDECIAFVYNLIKK